MLERIFGYIEGLPFAATVNVANDFRTFVRALDLDETQRELNRLAALGETSGLIGERIEALLSDRSDIRYENPHDASLATYLRVLFYNQSPLAARWALAVVDAPRLWWAEYVARTILKNVPSIAVSRAGSEITSSRDRELTDARLALLPNAGTATATSQTISLHVTKVEAE